MATISFGGLGNGIDYGQVVTQLVQLAQQPIDKLTTKKNDLGSKSVDYATLSTKLVGLQSAADKLRLSTSFDRSSTSVSDATVLGATASSTASPGTYQVQVSQLAQSDQIISIKGVAATTTNITGGSVASFSFSLGSGGSTQTVTLSATDTLENLRDKINDLGAGVTASIINTGSGASPYRLVLTSTNSGLSNKIYVTTDTTTLDFTNLSTTGGSNQLQAAQDAKVVIGTTTTPVTLSRSSNTVSDAIPGVTLTLLKAGTVQVTAASDIGAVKNNITALATAYNDVVKFINERNTYDIASKKGGIFFNEPAVRTVLSKLRSALSASVPGLSSYGSVGEIGFKTERDGTITVDDAKLDSALRSNYGAVKSLFVQQGSTAGVAQLVTNAVDSLDDVAKGAITLRKNSLTGQISKLGDEIARKQDQLAQYQERLQRQYAALDSLLGQMKTQSGYMQANSSLKKQN